MTNFGQEVHKQDLIISITSKPAWILVGGVLGVAITLSFWAGVTWQDLQNWKKDHSRIESSIKNVEKRLHCVEVSVGTEGFLNPQCINTQGE